MLQISSGEREVRLDVPKFTPKCVLKMLLLKWLYLDSIMDNYLSFTDYYKTWERHKKLESRNYQKFGDRKSAKQIQMQQFWNFLLLLKIVIHINSN